MRPFCLLCFLSPSWCRNTCLSRGEGNLSSLVRKCQWKTRQCLLLQAPQRETHLLWQRAVPFPAERGFSPLPRLVRIPSEMWCSWSRLLEKAFCSAASSISSRVRVKRLVFLSDEESTGFGERGSLDWQQGTALFYRV